MRVDGGEGCAAAECPDGERVALKERLLAPDTQAK